MIKKITLTVLLVFCGFIGKAQNLALTYDNPQITNDGTNDFYEVDVFVTRISATDFKMGDGQFYLDYNPLAFGSSIGDATVDFEYTSGSVLAEVNVLAVYGSPVINSNAPTTVSIAWPQALSAGSMATENVTDTPTLLGHLKIQMIETAETADICFNVSGNAFDDQFYTACGPFAVGVAIKDCTGVNAGNQIFDYDGSDCSGGIVSCLDTAVWTAGGWDISPLVPASSTNVTILSDYDTSIVGESIEACQLTIDAGATVVVAPGDYIEVGGDILVTLGSTLTVEHTGCLVQIDDAAVVTNDGSINVNITTPALNARDFLILGSPMTQEDDTVFTDMNGAGNSAYQVLNHTTANFTPYTGTPPVVGVNFHDQESNDWTNFSGSLLSGEGYLVRPSYTVGSAYDYQFNQGTLNNGIITYTAFFGDDKEDSPNVLSNPYACAIDADLMISNNAIIDEIYFWEHNTIPSSGVPGPLGENFNMEDISTRNLGMGIPASTGGTTPNGIISAGQGFGIKANAAGDVTFNNAQRLTSGNTTLRSIGEKDLIWIEVRENTYGLGCTAGIAFTENATSGLDAGYDTMKLGTVVSLYSHLLDGSEQLGIQGRETFDPSSSIPMGFSTQIEADAGIPYVISVSNVEGLNIEGVDVYLVDHLSSIVTNITTDRYEFLSDAGTFDNRFTLQFQPLVLNLNNPSQATISIFPNPTENIINIVSPSSLIDSVDIYDLRGRTVNRKMFSSEEDYYLDLSGLESAVYFVKISTSNGTITKRIVKN